LSSGFSKSGLCACAVGSEQQPMIAQASEHNFLIHR